jgi:hypothetical protein
MEHNLAEYLKRSLGADNLSYLADKDDISIDAILSSDSEALLDKIKLSASMILARLNIHEIFSREMDADYIKINNEILRLEGSSFSGNYVPDNSRATLNSQILMLNQKKLEERKDIWKDLLLPLQNLIELINEHKEVEMDKKMLK